MHTFLSCIFHNFLLYVFRDLLRFKIYFKNSVKSKREEQKNFFDKMQLYDFLFYPYLILFPYISLSPLLFTLIILIHVHILYF